MNSRGRTTWFNWTRYEDHGPGVELLDLPKLYAGELEKDAESQEAAPEGPIDPKLATAIVTQLKAMPKQAVERFLLRRGAHPFDRRLQLHLGHRQPFGRDLLGRSLCAIFIRPDCEAGHPRQMQERKHVAARQGRDQHFLRIDRRLHRPFAHDMRRG